MLTRKQAWRRCRTRSQRNPEQEWETILAGEIYQWDSSQKMLAKVRTWDAISGSQKVSQDIRSKSCTFGMKQKRVGFDPTVRVVLIPSLSDIDDQTKEDVWWSSAERDLFKKFSFEFWKEHGTLKCLDDEGEVSDSEEPVLDSSSDVSPQSTSHLSSPTSRDAQTSDSHLPSLSYFDEHFFLRSKPIPLLKSGSENAIAIPCSSSSSPNVTASWPSFKLNDKHWVSFFTEKYSGEQRSLN